MSTENLHALAALIRRERDTLLARWREEVRQLAGAHGLDVPTLNNHIRTGIKQEFLPHIFECLSLSGDPEQRGDEPRRHHRIPPVYPLGLTLTRHCEGPRRIRVSARPRRRTKGTS